MRKNISKLSVVLATYNEENNLARCLDSVKAIADEIIVVDGSSTDKTKQIAHTYTNHVFETKNRLMFHTNKQMAIDNATTEWVLQLDADEVVTAQLKKEIRDTISDSNTFAAYDIPRKNFFLGKWLKKGGLYPDRVIRLFRRGKAFLPQKSVHEQMQVNGKVGHLKHHLLHYTAPTLYRYLENANRYTSQTALELEKTNVSINLNSHFKYLFIMPCSTFFNLFFFRHRGFMDGSHGWVFAVFSGIHWPLAYFKYYERSMNPQKSTAINSHNSAHKITEATD